MKAERTPVRQSRTEIALSIGAIVAGVAMGAGGIYKVLDTPEYNYPPEERSLPTATPPQASRIESGATNSTTPEPTADFRRFIKYMHR